MNQHNSNLDLQEKAFQQFVQQKAEEERRKAEADAVALQQQMAATAQPPATENQPSNEPSQEGGAADTDMLNLEENEAEVEEDRADGAAKVRQ